MPSLGPCHFVVFGATGHLASTQLLPSLYALEVAGRLPPDLRLSAFARRDWTREQWRRHLTETLEKRVGTSFAPGACTRLAQRFDYVRGDLHDPEAYRRLLAQMGDTGAGDNAVFYLAVPPADFDGAVRQLARAGGNRTQRGRRIIVEKPFGEDIDSARQLNRLLHEHFDEEQIYRIDHYLGKETVQNLFVFRFANTLVEPVWNRNYVDHVQITVAESAGIGRRAGYYERAGALRDMLQNHLLQLLAITAMEPPARFDADALRDEKAKVLRAVRPIRDDEVEASAVRAQYAAGMIDGSTVPGYRDEPGVAPDSATETYAAARLHVDNWRWGGVPFYLRTGKRLARKLSLVALRFRRPPQLLFRDLECAEVEPNWMVLSIQPREAMQVEIQAKQPGAGFVSRTVRLDALYRESDGPPIEAYQALLLDAIQGDRTLFLRFDEVEWAWRVIDPILRRWQRERGSLPTYPAGSWGPTEAERLFERDDRRWRGQA